MKYYAVKKGRQTGIFTSWDVTEKQVKGYPAAKFKSFKTQAEAKQYLSGQSQLAAEKRPVAAKSGIADAEIVLYTDGGSRNHGNVKGGHVKANDKAAWAYLIVNHGKRIANSGGEWGATNNRMEIMAFYQALNYLNAQGLQDDPITAVLDSKYVLNAVTKGWLKGWQRRGWTKSGGGKLENKELWQQVADKLRHFSHITFHWTKGHADNEGNVYVDELLNRTMDQMKTKAPQSDRPTVINPNADRLAAQTASKAPHHDTQESVHDIEQNLKQLGLFDDDQG